MKGGNTTQAKEKWALIERNFTTYHATPEQAQRFAAIQDKAKELAHLIAATTKESKEQAIALNELESVLSWVDKAIARE